LFSERKLLLNNKIYVTAIIIIGLVSSTFSQTIFRRAAYLSQSVGTHIYDHSQVGSSGTTTVPNEVAVYNFINGYNGDNAFTIYNPTDDYPPGGNQMWKWQKAFYDYPGYSFKEDYLDTDTYDIIMVKFCAASQSGIWYWWYEGPQDTINYPETQSTYNYQWYMRKIVRKMEEYPNKFFFLWNIPSATEQESSPADMQRLADFNKWMTDTLQAGLDSYGAFPPNVKIFDFFNLLKSPNSNYMDPIYRDSPTDYHPNALASSVVAPILVQQMFDAAIAYEFFTAGTTFQFSIQIQNGWNMVSVPGLHPVNQNVSTWWPNRNLSADVYKWTTTYEPVTFTNPGEGYWMLHSGNQTYNTGDEWPAGGIQIVANNPIPLREGWNMIGGYENSPLVSGLTTTPPGLIVPNTTYGWNGTYINSTNLFPGFGYCILSTGAGVINPPTMAAVSSKIVLQDEKSEWGKITVTDASGRSYTLYSVDGEVNINQYSMPPLPPAGMFDVRYSSNRKAEDLSESNQTIEMRGLEYPVILKVEKMSIKLEDETGKIVSERLNSGEELVVNNSHVIKLRVSSEVIPEIYSLEQNYPNPFNPATKIRFTLPEAGNVKLKIYNILGQEIRRLVDEYKEIGVYTINFDASGLNSGIYIYKVEVNRFIQTRKMTLLK
jgi:hypothetical protein